ncbi:glycosyltransferase [Streptomyces sp. NPDC001478]
MKPTVCLCMIVRNEARVVERCLASVRDLVDTWVISDTGSTDGTQALVRRALDGIPGELHQDPWRDFGHNRTLNIRRAHARADYLLLVDADHVVHRRGPLPELTADAYLLRHEGPVEHRIKRLVRGDVAWRYEGVTREHLTAGAAEDQRLLDALVIHDHADGGSRHGRAARDARLLGSELERDPANTRTVFHLAQALRDLGERERAVALYERRARMGGWAEEVYCSLLQAGILRADAGDWPSAMDALSRAWEVRPQRLEACYELVWRLRGLGRHHTAHSFVRAGLDREPPEDLLAVQPWVYRWGLLFEYSVTAYRVGEVDEALRACDRLLALPDLPRAYRDRTLANRAWAGRRRPAPNASWASPPDWRRGPHVTGGACAGCGGV